MSFNRLSFTLAVLVAAATAVLFLVIAAVLASGIYQGENGWKPPNVRTLSLLPCQPVGAVALQLVSPASFHALALGKAVFVGKGRLLE